MAFDYNAEDTSYSKEEEHCTAGAPAHMKEHIYTIPLHELLEEKDGCPICRLHEILEKRCVEYITGAAMMEPDIRVETNRLGFCREHLLMMKEGRTKLPLALLLETRLAELQKDHFEKKKHALSVHTCYVCDRIDSAMDKMLDNFMKQFGSDLEFRKLFTEQEFLCLDHYEALHERSEKKLKKKERAEFQEAIRALTEPYLDALQKDVHFFTTRFDYRFGGQNADWGTSKDSIDRSIRFMTGRSK